MTYFKTDWPDDVGLQVECVLLCRCSLLDHDPSTLHKWHAMLQRVIRLHSLACSDAVRTPHMPVSIPSGVVWSSGTWALNRMGCQWFKVRVRSFVHESFIFVHSKKWLPPTSSSFMMVFNFSYDYSSSTQSMKSWYFSCWVSPGLPSLFSQNIGSVLWWHLKKH